MEYLFYGTIIFREKVNLCKLFTSMEFFNFFTFSPPNTVFGPITGSIQINKIQNIKSIFRFFIIPLFYKISLLILNLRNKENYIWN